MDQVVERKGVAEVYTAGDFSVFKAAVAKQFQTMQKHPMFRVRLDRDALWETYLRSFPPGSNPIFRERTEHDCSCCKQFIRAVGDVVAVVDGELVSLWDVQLPESEPAYAQVARALAEVVRSQPIAEPFLHEARTAGTDRTFEQVTEGTRTWNHFHVNIESQFVAPKDSIPSRLAQKRTTFDVLKRALQEITVDAVDTVLELVAQGSLYRGEEHKQAVEQFQTLQLAYNAVKDTIDGDLFIWLATDATASATHIRNTVIGTLLTDLSEGKDLEDAVKAFEGKVAPTNYKRPKSLITPAMIERAKQTIEELGLTSALDRRYATIDDITINNVLFADRSVKKRLTGGVFDDLAAEVGNRVTKELKGVEDVPIDRFISEILPRAESIEVLLENRHGGNLVSLIAPSDPTAGRLFKWENNFSWSYAGELADSIKERVKRAGGSVVGDLCCRLAWHNYDDLDFHMVEPGGYHISFRDKRSFSGQLDVDMNVGCGQTREPVENIFYANRSRMREGVYHLFVNQFNNRESTDVGFEVEIDFLGTVHRFAYDRQLRTDENVTVAKFRYTHKDGFEIIESLPSSQASRTVWGLPTQAFHRVKAMLLSPNHWDGVGIGNKHYFFMLDGCQNDGTARGFFNEFLKSDLDRHRKVFEVVGSKMKPANTPNQLSGLGFSSTQKNTLTCRVKGSFTRTINVVF